MSNSITRLFDKITRKKERVQRKIAISRFTYYRSTARMLAVALDKGMEFVPDFLELTDYISYLTLTFKRENSDAPVFVLPELRRFGWQSQADSLETVINNSYLPMSKNESSMREYIELLWDLFHTPDPL